MEISDLKSAATLLTRYCTIKKMQGFSNEMQHICVARRAVKLREVKFEGPKKIASSIARVGKFT